MTASGGKVQARRHRTSWLIVAVTAVAAFLVGGLPSPASAVGVVRTPYTNPPETFSDDSCGYVMTVTRSSSGTFSVRTGTGRASSVLFFTDNYSFREVRTNPATGQSFVVRGNGQIKDVQAKPLGDNIFEIVTKESGQPLVVEDSHGKVVLRAAGVVSFRFRINTHGNPDPNTWDFVEFLGVTVAGPHPETSVCKIAGSFWGTGSADRLTPHPVGTTDSPLGYYEYLPPGYGPGAKAPLLIFLHGFGESGNGGSELPNLISNSGITFYISTNGWPANRPFVVLSPQHNYVESPAYPYPCDGEFPGSCLMKIQHDKGNPAAPHSPCTTPDEVKAFLGYAITHYNVDPTRVYLTGLSCGGYGVWESLAEFGAGRIAAAVPISGDGRPAQLETGCAMAAVPIWAFTGEADDVVNPAGTIETAQALQDCVLPPPRDVDVTLTVYPGVGHDAWDHAYSGSQGQDIYTWMLSRSTT